MKRTILWILFLLSVTNLKAQIPGNQIFADLHHEIHITMPTSTWFDTLSLYYTQSATLDSNLYLPCTIQFDNTTLNNAGIRFKGNSSYGHPNQKKSFKIDFSEFYPGQKLDLLKQINLNNGYNDPTFLREKLYLDFCQQAGLDAPRCAYANVYINGALWGFYTVVEEIDKTFLETHFSNNGGNLFKGDPQGHLKWMGPLQSNYYNSYELKTNETQNDWTDLVHFIDKINSISSNPWSDSVNPYFNLYAYLPHYAGTMLFATLDSYTGSGHNYYLYHNTVSNQFEFIQWDVNGSFGRHHPSGQGLTNEALLSPLWVPTPSGSRPLHEHILADPTLQQTYLTHLCQFVHSHLDTNIMIPKIDSFANLIRNHVYADPRKQFSNAEFENNLTNDYGMNTPGLKKFVRERYAYLLSFLQAYGCSPNQTENITQTEIKIYPNPVSDQLFIVGLTGQTDRIKLTDIAGRNHPIKINQQMPSDISIDVSCLPRGIYILSFDSHHERIVVTNHH